MISEQQPCPACGSQQRQIILTPDLPHYGKILCDCGHFLGWAPKPDSEKVRRPAKHRNLVQKYSAGYCELCLIAEDNLPDEQTLEAQHIIEFEDGGGHERENIQIICTKCHKLIHWLRTYATPKGA